MSYVGWVVLLIFLLTGGTLFFSLNAVALRIFSRVKLQEAFKAANKKGTPEKLANQLVENAEELILTCSLYRLILNMCILLLLVAAFANSHASGLQIKDYVLTFIIAAAIFSVFCLAVPHAWAKYAGEKTLSRTYKLLLLFERSAWPILCILKAYDGFVRRLAGVVEATPQEKHEERQEEFLSSEEWKASSMKKNRR